MGLGAQIKEKPSLAQTLGEALIRTLLARRNPEQIAARVGAAWVGDHLASYGDGDLLITAWLSAWNNEASALDFFAAYKTVLEINRRARLESFAGKKERLQAQLADGSSLWLERRGPVVLFLDGMPLSQALELAQDIWSDLEVESVPQRLPFDQASRRFQLSRARK